MLLEENKPNEDNDGLGAKIADIGKKALKAGWKSLKTMGLVGGLGLGGIMSASSFVTMLIYIMIPAAKSYDISYINNQLVRDMSSVYSDSDSVGSTQRSLLRSLGNMIGSETSYGEERVVLSEENQAIENYHYYNSMKSLYSNKYYYPIENVELEGGQGGLEELLDKGVFIRDEENNRIIFNEEYIGKLKKVDDENEKLKIKDEYGREPYFQIPEELLAMLNTAVYNGKVVYDKPFLKGVDFIFRETDKKDLGRPIYQFEADYSSFDSGKVSDFGLGSVFIYKPTFELQMNEVADNSINKGVNGLIYMGDSLFVKMKDTGVSSSNIVAKKDYTVKQGYEKHLSTVVKRKPENIVMSYGTTDCINNGNVTEFYNTYKKIIEDLRKELPNIKIYLTTLLMSESKYPNVAQFNEKINQLAGDIGVTVINSSSVFEGKESELFKEDGVNFKGTEGLSMWRSDIENKIGAILESEKNEEVTEEMKVDEIAGVNLKYILDRVITFAGVYRFEYEVETVGENGNAVSQVEKPIGIVRESIDNTYIYKYLKNFSTEVPKNLYKGFTISDIVYAFKGDKNSVTGAKQSSGEGVTGGGGSDAEAVEQWRPLVEEIAAGYGMNPNVILSMIWSESSGNPHTGNKNYKGLVAMGANHSWLKEYFQPGDETAIGGDYTKTGTSNDPRVPACSGNNHNEAEHKRAATFQIHYACRRMTDTMYKHSKRMFNKEPVDLTSEEMFYVVAASIGAYNTGEGGQNKMRALANFDYKTLYSPNGEKWKEYHYKADAALGGAINSKANCTYMKKQFDFYPVLTGGIPFNESGELSLYNPALWYVVSKNAGKFDGYAESTTGAGTNGISMNQENVSAYVEREEDESNGYVTAVASVDENMVDLVLDQAVGMIEGKVYTAVKGSKDAFWRDGYETEYFRDGVASKAPPGYNMESGIWKDKIAETEYTGDTEGILDLAKMYGQGMFKVINKVISQLYKPYELNSSGTMSYDMKGLIWYAFNYGEEKSLFDVANISKYHGDFMNEVEEEDLRPGDISFFTTTGDLEEKASDAIIYVGNDAGVYVNEDIKEVTLVKYSEFKDDIDKRLYLGTKRILKFTQGIAGEFEENKNALAGMPTGFVEGDWAFPVLFNNKEDIRLTDGVGVRQIHPATGRPNIPHFGVDYAGPEGTPIVATKAGKVIESRATGGAAGEIVKIDHGDGSSSAYYHLVPGSRRVSVGQQVAQGEVIGGLGHSGRGTGDHLHFEIAIGLPNHQHGASRDMSKFVPIQNMFKELGIKDARRVPHNTIYPGNPSHWNNRNP